jgi:hypothetical protein
MPAAAGKLGNGRAFKGQMTGRKGFAHVPRRVEVKSSVARESVMANTDTLKKRIVFCGGWTTVPAVLCCESSAKRLTGARVSTFASRKV